MISAAPRLPPHAHPAVHTAGSPRVRGGNPGLRGSSTNKKRRFLRAAALALIVLLAIALTYAARVVSILVAYKAKQLCSGVFVAGRDARAVATELAVDDLGLLRYIDANVDVARQSTVASAMGLIRREAVYRGASGCTLVLEPDSTSNEAGATWSPALAGPQAPPQRVATPLPALEPPHEAVGAVVERAFAEPDPVRPRRTRAVVIVHDGRIVAERYANGIDPDTPLIGWSMTKSVMNALAGVLVREGRMTLDRPLGLREWSAPDDERRAITLDHLLHMSSGLEFDEQMTTPLTDVVYMLLAVPDMAAFAANKPLEVAPGTRWRYSSGTSVILAAAMRRVIGSGEDYAAFPRRALFDPLGMSSAIIETDAAGTFVGSSLMWASARDWARFGMLYLQDGVWNGTRVLPDGWVEYTRTPAPADSTRRYGAHFWLDLPDGYRASDAKLPADAFHAAGHQGQFVTIVPSRAVVIVRLGGTRHRDAWDQAAFVSAALDALEP